MELEAGFEIEEMLAAEVQYIEQQNDRELMEQMLGEVEEFASTYGYYVDVESAIVAIGSSVRSNYAGRNVRATTVEEESFLEDSDESIDELFAKLRE